MEYYVYFIICDAFPCYTSFYGDTLFVYTDGVAEACDEEHTLFGTEGMIEALNHNPDADCKTLINHLLQEVQFFIGTADQFDDITMLALKIL